MRRYGVRPVILFTFFTYIYKYTCLLCDLSLSCPLIDTVYGRSFTVPTIVLYNYTLYCFVGRLNKKKKNMTTMVNENNVAFRPRTRTGFPLDRYGSVATVKNERRLPPSSLHAIFARSTALIRRIAGAR